MAYFPPYKRGGGRGQHFMTSQHLEMFENRPGKLPLKTRVAPDPKTGFFKLHVRSIPRNWDKTKLEAVCSKIGSLKSCFVKPHGSDHLTWGFVEYETFQDASLAINEINGNILTDGIIVSFAREKVDPGAYYDVDVELMDDWPPSSSASSSNQQIRTSARELPPDPAKITKLIKNHQSFSANMPIDHFSIEPQDPELVKRIEDLVLKRVINYNKRLDPSGKCQACQAPCSHKCWDCKAFYCSEQCLDKDWLIHSQSCEPATGGSKPGSKTDLRAGGDSRMSNGHSSNVERASGYNRNRSDETSQFNDRSMNRFSGRSHFDDKRRDDTRNINGFERGGGRQSDNEKPRNIFEERKARFSGGRQSEAGSSMDQKPYQNQNNRNNFHDRNPPKIQHQSDFTPRPSAPSTYSSQNVSTQNLHKSVLTMGSVELVSVTSIEAPGVFYVTPKKLMNDLKSILDGISNEDRTFPSFAPVIDGICVAEFSETWSRCQVINLQPLTVRYIDFGNIEVLTPERLFTIPSEFAAQPPLAVKIKLVTGTPEFYLKLQASDSLSVKPIQLLDDCWLCEVVGQEPGQAQDAGPMKTPTSPTTQAPQQKAQDQASAPHKLLPPGCFTKVYVQNRNGTSLAVTPVANKQDLEWLTERLQTEGPIASPLNSIPQRRLKCMTKSSHDNKWYRVMICNPDTLSVYFVDKGHTEDCSKDNLRVLPVALGSISPHVVNIRGRNGISDPLFQRDIFAVKRVDRDDDLTWVVDVAEVPKEEIPQVTKPTQSTSLTTQSTQQVLPQSTFRPALSPSQPTPSVVAASSSRPEPIFPSFLPSDEFTTVFVALPEPNENGLVDTYYVGPTTLLSTIIEMGLHFHACAPHCEQLIPQLGALGICLFEGLLYRVKIVDLSPLRVQYIDYGNIEEIKPEELKKCPDTHKDVPSLVHKIKLAAGTDPKYFNLSPESTLSVKPVSVVPDGAVMVQVEGEIYSESSSTNKAPETSPASVGLTQATNGIIPMSNNVTNNPVPAETNVLAESPKMNVVTETPVQNSPTFEHPTSTEIVQEPVPAIPEQRRCQNLVDLLQENSKCMIIPADIIEDHFVGIINSEEIPKEMILDGNLNSLLESHPHDPNFKPSVGELVACRLMGEDSWHRGKLLTDDNLCDLIDVGEVQFCSQIKQLPENLASIPSQAIVFSLENTNTALLNILYFQELPVTCLVTGILTDSDGERICKVQGEIGDTNCTFTGRLQGWNFKPLAMHIPLKSGYSVVISKVLSSNSVMVTPVDKFNVAQQKIQIECRKPSGEKLKSPKEGDYVAFLNPENDIYVRSQVMKVDTVKNEYVLYDIDSGDQAIGNLANLHLLPTSLSQLPRRASKVVLKGVDLKEQTEQSQLYISYIASNEKVLTVEINQPDRSVTLTTAEENENVNDKLQLLIQPQILPDLNGKLTLRSLPEQVVRFGEEVEVSVSQTEPLYLTKTVEMQRFYDQVNGLYYDIQLYCETETAPYNPCEGEVCLVKFEGEWYRAECLRETNQGISAVMLIDFGNIINTTTSDIRQMKPDFLVVPPLAFGCKIIGLPTEIPPALKARLDQLLEVYTKYQNVFESFSNGCYNVNVPSLISTLKDEGLI